MTSIRKRLLVSILSVIVFITILLATVTYFSVREEMDELYDENMKQVALVLARTGLEDDHISQESNNDRRKLKGEEEFLIQIWQKGKIAYSSHPKIKFELQEQGRKGYGRVLFSGNRWRYYQLYDGADVIQISQDLAGRHDVIVEIYRALVVPILIQMPILIVLIWLSVGYGFRPLMRVSDNIRKRTPTFLEPLSEDKTPVEVQTFVVALNDLLMRLKSALEGQRRFTSDAAHELRTPLTAIKLQLDILKRASDIQEKETAIVSLEQGINRGIHLVQQLLELARQEPENVNHPHEKIYLDQILAESVEDLRPLALSKFIHISTNISPDLIINGNSFQMNAMFSNLLNNAVIYGLANGHVQIDAFQQGNQIIVNIADDGIGIAMHERSRIFDRFFRVAGTNVMGSGLGLSIVKSIGVSHGIDISVHEGLNGRGASFRLSINSAT